MWHHETKLLGKRPGMSDKCLTPDVLTPTLSLMPIPAAPSTTGQQGRTTTMGFLDNYTLHQHNTHINTTLSTDEPKTKL